MTTQTLLHLLYFLPALIVYGVWTWTGIVTAREIYLDGKETSDITNLLGSAWLGIHCTAIMALVIWLVGTSTIEGIKYFSN